MPIVVAGCFFSGFLGCPPLLQFSFCVVAAISQSLIQKRLGGLPVEVKTFRLESRAFIPVQSQPGETIQDVLGVFRTRSRLVCVFYSQNKLTAVVTGK